MYEYHTVQIPPNIGVQMDPAEGAAAAHLKGVIDRHTKYGWGCCSVERIGIVESMGCCYCCNESCHDPQNSRALTSASTGHDSVGTVHTLREEDIFKSQATSIRL